MGAAQPSAVAINERAGRSASARRHLRRGPDHRPGDDYAICVSGRATSLCDTVRRGVNEDGLADVYNACLLESRCNLIDPRIAAVDHQPAQAATPEPAMRDAQFLGHALQSRVVLERLRRRRAVAGFEAKKPRGKAIGASREQDEVNDDNDCEDRQNVNDRLQMSFTGRDANNIAAQRYEADCEQGDDQRPDGYPQIGRRLDGADSSFAVGGLSERRVSLGSFIGIPVVIVYCGRYAQDCGL